MTLKYKLDSIDALDDVVKKMYTKQADGYVLNIDGLPKNEDVSGLKPKVEQLLSEKKSEKEKREAAEEQARKSAEGKARKDGDIEALEKSWGDKFAAREKELSGTIDTLTGSINGLTVDREAIAMAAELAVDGSAEVLLPHIKQRLSVEVREGKHVTVVRDASGKASALTLVDLKKEIAESKAFAPLIVASRASGGGAGGGSGERSGGSDADCFDKKPPHFSRTKQTEIYREDPERYKQLKSASGQ